ncbi:MAG: sugar phosphate isomerase/epimerase [Planctomycetes bacterium]|nr:sugar phosphate isomerase/epimerase [Planctomycetota bacterium]
MPSSARSESTLISRRALLRLAGGSAALLACGGLRVWCADATPAAIVPGAAVDFGVCGGLGNAGTYKEALADYIEEGVGNLLMPDKDDATFAKRSGEIAAAVVPVRCCNTFIPAALKSVGPAAAHDAILAYADTAFKRARACGVTTITFGSGGSRKVPDGFAKDEAAKQFTALLTRLGPLAAAQQVVVAVEPLNVGECNFLNSIGDVAAVVGPANHPAVGITADLYHMVLAGDLPADLEKHIGLLRHFHIAEKLKRAMPGVAGDDFRGWFRVLAKHGWKGRMSIESNGGGDAAAYSKSIAYLRAQAKEAGI